MSIQAVIFDVDGTLYPNSAMYRHSALYVIRNFFFFRNFSQIRKDIRKFSEIDDFYQLQADLLARRLGKTTEQTLSLINEKVRQWEDRLAGIRFVSGIENFLHRLDKEGIPRGLLSDFPVKRKLDIIGLGEGWSCSMSTEEIGYLKPDIRPFHAAADEIGIPADRILYVGNSYSYDVLGAKAAGMQAAHLSRKTYKDSIADFTFTDYSQLEGWVFSGLHN
ncbi:HAD family hydrolase [Spirochaeta dissipatitropha]